MPNIRREVIEGHEPSSATSKPDHSFMASETRANLGRDGKGKPTMRQQLESQIPLEPQGRGARNGAIEHRAIARRRLNLVVVQLRGAPEAGVNATCRETSSPPASCRSWPCPCP